MSSKKIVRNGTNKSGAAQYKCKYCGTCRVLKKKATTQSIDKSLPCQETDVLEID